MADCAVVFTGREQAELLPDPRDESPLAADEVAGSTLCTVVSAGTELQGAYLGESFPRRPGYAAVFRVETAGDAVTDLRPGDLAYCSGPHRSWQRAPRARTLPVPRGLAPETAVFCRMMGVSMSTLVTTRARPPDRVLVTGLGLVGHLAAQVFAACGYRVGACDPSGPRRAHAEAAGLAPVLDRVPVNEPEWQDRTALVLECSGHEGAVVDACRLVRKGGEVALIGAPWRRYTELSAQELAHLVFFRYVCLRSGWEWELPQDATEFRGGSIWENYEAALDWLARGKVSVEGLFSRMAPAECQQAFQDLLHHRTPRLAVVFDWTALTGGSDRA